MTAAIRSGIVRKIVHVIPAGSWPDVERNLRSFPWARRWGGTYRLTVYEGVPLIIMRLQDVQPHGEIALVSINEALWTAAEMDVVIRLINSGALKADIITISGGRPASISALRVGNEQIR